MPHPQPIITFKHIAFKMPLLIYTFAKRESHNQEPTTFMKINEVHKRLTNRYKGGISRWQTQVTTHHSQSISAQKNFDPNQDFWEGSAHMFRDDPFRKNDLIVDRLIKEYSECNSIIDIGGGAGRLALPLALRKDHVTVIDSSQAMLNELKNISTELNIKNLSSIYGLWEKTFDSIESHDGSLCSHVIYGIEDIETFITAINSVTNKRAVIIAFMESPQGHLGDIWNAVHGEKRIHLPATPQLMDVLWEMGLEPELSILETYVAHRYENRKSAMADLMSRLYINKGTKEHKIIEDMTKRILVNTNPDNKDEVELTGSGQRSVCLITWNPKTQ